MSVAADVIPTPVKRRALVMFAVILATGMSALDLTIGAVALPHMRGTFSATPDQVSWVLTSYIVATAVVMPLTGWLSERLGRKRLFVTAIVGFIAASVLCGLASSLHQEVLFRTIQGAFGAPLVPLSQSIVLDSHSREEQGRAMSIWGFGVTLSPILGPVIGGFLTEDHGWPWIFYINVPLGLITLIAAIVAIPPDAKRPTNKVDGFGFAALALFIACTQLVLDRGERQDWFASVEILIETGLAALGLYLFVVHSMTAERPFLDRRLFGDRNYVIGLVLVFLFGFILLPPLFMLPIFLQDLRGYPLSTVGLILAPRGIGAMIGMVLAGRILNYTDARVLIGGGYLLFALAGWEMAGWTSEVGNWDLNWTGLVQGLGMGVVYVPLFTLAFSTLDGRLRTQATGLFQLMRNFGSSLAVAVFVTLFARNTTINRSDLLEHFTLYRSTLLPEQWSLDTVKGIAALNAELTRQAEMIAYANNFFLLALAALIAVPVVFLYRMGRPAGAR